MIRAMGHWLGLAVLCYVPVMAGEWVQELPAMPSALISWPTP